MDGGDPAWARDEAKRRLSGLGVRHDRERAHRVGRVEPHDVVLDDVLVEDSHRGARGRVVSRIGHRAVHHCLRHRRQLAHAVADGAGGAWPASDRRVLRQVGPVTTERDPDSVWAGRIGPVGPALPA